MRSLIGSARSRWSQRFETVKKKTKALYALAIMIFFGASLMLFILASIRFIERLASNRHHPTSGLDHKSPKQEQTRSTDGFLHRQTIYLRHKDGAVQRSVSALVS